jgi:FMN hydrolase / 5-amino-6-(5-phospho-D-ribitylamino)uracil phosphatase
MVGAVSFDADGTLWDFDRVMRRALQITLAELRRRRPGEETSALTVEELIAIRDEVAADHRHDWSRLEDIRLAAFNATLVRLDLDDPALARELNTLYLRHRFDDIELFDDVADCLDAVGRRHPIGLLSNGNSYPERCGLDGRFAFTVFAEQHGTAKPDPALFEIAAEAAGCSIDELVHVGDGEADVVGAHRAGCRVVLINRSRARLPFADEADAEVADLREVPAILEEWQADHRHGPPPR